MKKGILKSMGMLVFIAALLSSNLPGIGVESSRAIIGAVWGAICFVLDAKQVVDTISEGSMSLHVEGSVPVQVRHVGDIGEYYVQVDATVSNNTRYYLVANIKRDDGENLTEQSEDLVGPKRYLFKFIIEGHQVGVDHIFPEVKLYQYVTKRVGFDKTTYDVEKPEYKLTATAVKQPFDIKVPYRLERVEIDPDKNVKHRENFTVTLYATVSTQASGNVSGQIMGASFNKTISGIDVGSEAREEELGSYKSCHAKEETVKGKPPVATDKVVGEDTGKLIDEYEGTPPHLEKQTFDVVPLNAHFVIPKGNFRIHPNEDYVLDLNASNSGIPSGDLKITCVGAHVMGELGDSIGGKHPGVKVVPGVEGPDVEVEPPETNPPEVEKPGLEVKPPKVEPVEVKKPDVDFEPPKVEPPEVEPPEVEPAVEPPAVEPPAVEPAVQPPKVEGSGVTVKPPEVTVKSPQVGIQKKDIQMKDIERR